MIKLDFLNNDYVDKRSIQEKAYEQILIDILTGEIKHGTWLTEKEISERFNMSRTPVREVFHNLSNTPFVKLIPNRGAFVNSLTYRDLDDFYAMESALYPLCVKLAIERITEEELSQLDEIFTFMEFYTKTFDMEKMFKINQGFDYAIYNACRNPELEKNLKFYDFVIQYGTSGVPFPNNYLNTVLEEHREIYNAFRKHNPNLGYEAALSHMYKRTLRRK